MGKPTGFVEFQRELPPDRDALTRIGDWKEIHHHHSDEKLQKQGARCMDCGVPFCHTGKLIGGMASGCPINNLASTRPTTSRNSPAASALPHAKARVCSA
jgi:glutamate synthase (NADPH) small chain